MRTAQDGAASRMSAEARSGPGPAVPIVGDAKVMVVKVMVAKVMVALSRVLAGRIERGPHALAASAVR